MIMSMEVSLCCESWPENKLFHGLILAGVTPPFGQWEVVCDARLVGEQLTVCTCLALRETLLHIYGRKAGGWCERQGVMLQTHCEVLPPPKTQRKMFNYRQNSLCRRNPQCIVQFMCSRM